MTKEITLNLSKESRAALVALGLESPEKITLIHEEATVREVEMFNEAEEANRGKPELDWFGELLHRRVIEDVNPRVTVEAVKDLKPSKLAQHVAAFLTGELPDEKKTATATTQILTGMMANLASALASNVTTPSPDTFMVSAEKK